MIEVYENITLNSHPITILFDCCNYRPEKIHLTKLESIRKIKVDDLNIVEHKLNQYSDQLNKIIIQPPHRQTLQFG